MSKYFSRYKRSSPFKTPNAERPHRRKPKGDVDDFTIQAIKAAANSLAKDGKQSFCLFGSCPVFLWLSGTDFVYAAQVLG